MKIIFIFLLCFFILFSFLDIIRALNGLAAPPIGDSLLILLFAISAGYFVLRPKSSDTSQMEEKQKIYSAKQDIHESSEYKEGNSYKYCPTCGRKVDLRVNYCQHCGNDLSVKMELSRYCLECGRIISPKFHFCPHCGADLSKSN